jgi:hypothetical protein
MRIAEASDNSVLVRIVAELFDERHNPLYEQLGSHFETARAAGHRDRRAPRGARRDRQPFAAGAREAMAHPPRQLAQPLHRELVGRQATPGSCKRVPFARERAKPAKGRS